MPTVWVHRWRLLRPPLFGEPALWQCPNCDVLSRHVGDRGEWEHKRPSEREWKPGRPKGCTAGERKEPNTAEELSA